MSHATARATILREFEIARKAGAAAGLPIRYPNHRFDPPEAAPWLAVSLQTGETNPISLGPRGRDRTAFVLVVQVFLPEQTGTLQAYRVADDIAALNRKSVHEAPLTIHFRTATILPMPPENGWGRFNVTINGQYDKPTKTP